MKLESNNFSDMFQHVVDEYFNAGADPSTGVNLVDEFLEGNPHYTEALIFKARMLIALEEYDNALMLIDLCKKIDKWKRAYLFDEAEILYKQNKKTEAIKCIEDALRFQIFECIDGVRNFFVGIDLAEDEPSLSIVKNQIVSLISGNNDSFTLEELNKILG